ncbi:transmembrane protein, putative [Bodo saltans]|uniref:Transmembrane protein, putative n=1 Tax=Bodo saltans TaxID=75058 RepID=A0A0S4IN85_BODSA|nr:transmembrane protein, putative [Bodo saltans]|eukprot:CUE57578.1 transmembrane protein, putative [Bodo saltans]
MIQPMAWNGLSFLFSFRSPLPPTAYFDGCYVRNFPYEVQNESVVQWDATYFECLACNGDVLFVSTNNTQSAGISLKTKGIGLSAIGVAVLFGAAYVWFSVVSLRFGMLLAFGVFTRISTITTSKAKFVAVSLLAAYAVSGTYFTVEGNKQLANLMQSISVGNTWGGCKQYTTATGNITGGYFVYAKFDLANPLFSALNSETSDPIDFFFTYAGVLGMYLPIVAGYYSVLVTPYACLDAGELFVKETAPAQEPGGGGVVVDNRGASNHRTNDEPTIAKLIGSSIKYRVSEMNLTIAVLTVLRERSKAAKRAKREFTLLQSLFATFLVRWASDVTSDEDILLIERVVAEACRLESLNSETQLVHLLQQIRFVDEEDAAVDL